MIGGLIYKDITLQDGDMSQLSIASLGILSYLGYICGFVTSLSTGNGEINGEIPEIKRKHIVPRSI